MEAEIQTFWQDNPCGAELVGDLADQDRAAYEEFFDRYDRYRYAKEPHILKNLDEIDFHGKRVLEVGLGQGSDSEQIVLRGAIFTGVDLTDESVKRVRMRFALKSLAYEKIERSSALELPFPNEYFDIVFSHGVLHHIPEIDRAQREIRRVLRPDGHLIVMLYAKWSLNYMAAISIVRRLGLLALYAAGSKVGGIYGQHLENAREQGIFEYLKLQNFIHKNTDGPLNPYSKVYSLRDVRVDFSDFEVVKSKKSFMHAPPLPVGRLPLESLLGWHLWVHMKPRSK